MLLNFQKRFVPKIRSGFKRHTIRADRKIPPRVGEICHCYTGLRQPGAELLGRWPCTKVERIVITKSMAVRIDGEYLTPDECEALAQRDGFESFSQMMQFWDGRRPFSGNIIHWDFDHPVDPYQLRRHSRPTYSDIRDGFTPKDSPLKHVFD